MSALDNVEALVSAASQPALELQQETWQRINPKWRIVTRILVTMLSQESILSRLALAQTLNDLKAVLFIDHYLSRVRYGRFQEHIQTLLANPDVPLSVIERYAALSFAYEAIWQPEATFEETPLYSIAAAAVQLGMEPDEIYQDILGGKIQAELYLSCTEVARLLEETSG